MEKQIEELAGLIRGSFEGVRNPVVKSVRDFDLEKVAYKTILLLEDGLGKQAPEQSGKYHTFWYCKNPMTNIACDLGMNILMGKEDIEKPIHRRNIDRFKTGFHILNAMSEVGLIELTKGNEKRDKYRVRVCKGMEDTMEDLLFLADSPGINIQVYNRPQFSKPIPFEGFYHEEAGVMVRNTNEDANEYFTIQNCPKVFEVINKHIANAYRVNTDLLNIYRECQDDDIFTFADKDLTEEQLGGLERERNKVLEVADYVGGNKFWEYMFYDSRGRLYSSSNWLSHAGCKLSKSLFLLDDKQPIGTAGYYWILVHAANCWGEDKLSIDGRHDFADSKLDEWMRWAKDPVNNKGWQKADSPFEFLAAINEIKNIFNHEGDPFEYESGLLVAWDASCSGLQVLSALARDEESGALCNLTETEERGDYYLMIANEVWKNCEFTKKELVMFEDITSELRRLDRKVEKAFQSNVKERITEAVEERKVFHQVNKEDIKNSAKVYWGRPEMVKLKRKICKRPCMTYFYSCGAKTMSKAMMNDHGSEKEFKGLNSTYCFWLSKLIYKACQDLMPAPTALMTLFIQLGIDDYNKDKDFELNAPLTNFKFIQNYRMDKTEQVKITYKGKVIKPVVTIGKRELVDRNKVMSATSPNIVHMMDSQIVAAILLKADYTVSCIHDSFSAKPADAGRLYEDCRAAFVELFSNDILKDILIQKGREDLSVNYGKLDLTEIYDNEHNFS